MGSQSHKPYFFLGQSRVNPVTEQNGDWSILGTTFFTWVNSVRTLVILGMHGMGPLISIKTG